MNIDWQPFREIVDDYDRFVLSSHVRPDADALGSELALAELLTARGKSVEIINPSAAPSSLDFLDDERVQKFGNEATKQAIARAQVHVILDTSSWMQLAEVGKALQETSARRVVIDHHVSADDLGAIEFKDTAAEATGALVYRMAEALGWPISRDAARHLFCAIATDTGWFRFQSTTAETMRTAGRLMDLGAEPHVLYRLLYERYSLARLKLAGRVLSRIELQAGGRLAYTTVCWDDFVETGARPVDTEDLVNECLRIEGTECAFIAVEQQNRRIKFSLRSRSDFNVAGIAEEFGGGGHKQAAGAMLDGPLADAVERMVAALHSALEN